MNERVDPARKPERWHVERKVPLALIITFAGGILAQTFAFGVWAAVTGARLDGVEKKIEAAAPQGERLVRLEEKVSGVVTSLAEIKDMLRQRPDNRR